MTNFCKYYSIGYHFNEVLNKLKKLLILIIVFAFAFFAVKILNGDNFTLYNIKAPNKVTVQIKLPDSSWDTGYLKGHDMEYVAKCIPNGENAENSLVNIHFFDSSSNNYPDSYYNKFISLARKQAEELNSSVEPNVESTSANNIYFIWTIKGTNESEYCRFAKLGKGLYTICYNHKKPEFSEKERKEVHKILKSVTEIKQ